MFEGCPSLVCLGSAKLPVTPQPWLQTAEPACLVTSLHWPQGLRRKLRSLPFSFCLVAVVLEMLDTDCGKRRSLQGPPPWWVTAWSKPLWYCLQSKASEKDIRPVEASARLHSVAGRQSVVETLEAIVIPTS